MKTRTPAPAPTAAPVYVQDLWDRIARDAEAQPLSPAQAAELDRRLAAYRAQPEASIPWEVAREQLRRRG